jgi:tetratricopeptide (TPR) repeat protein
MMIGLLSLLICLEWGQMTTAQPNPHQLVQRGVEQYQQGEVTTAIAFWQQALKTYHDNRRLDEQTIVLENLGRAYQKLGKNKQATIYWQQTINNYRQLGDRRQLERSLTEQAQIYARLGQHQQAISILCGSNTRECLPDSAIVIAQQNQDRLGEVAAWGSLGEAYRLRGDYQLALPYLQTSLKMARQIKHSSLAIAALNSLGNTYSSLAQINYRRATSAQKRGENFGSNNLVKQIETEGLNSDRQGLKYFTESLQQASQQQDRSAQLKAIINALPLEYRLQKHDSAQTKIATALSLLPTLPISQDKVYTQIKLAKLLQPELVTPNSCYNSDIQPQAIQLLQQAIKEAKTVGDRRSQSFAWGELGHIYECRQDYQQALKLTKKARWLAEQDIEAKDSLYLWEWQAGRIYKQQQNKLAAVRAYQQAITTLDSIRQNILTSNRDIQFDFRDLVEPVYRQLIALQLDKIPTDSLLAATDDNFNSVLTVLDSFQLAELQNYFGNDCAIQEISNQEDISSNNSVAIFRSIVLPQRTAIIATFPDGDRQIVWLDREREALSKTVISFNESLVRWYDNEYDPTLATTLYDRMIRPFVTTLKQKQVQTLVFIQDGILRNMPMSALSI